MGRLSRQPAPSSENSAEKIMRGRSGYRQQGLTTISEDVTVMHANGPSVETSPEAILCTLLQWRQNKFTNIELTLSQISKHAL